MASRFKFSSARAHGLPQFILLPGVGKQEFWVRCGLGSIGRDSFTCGFCRRDPRGRIGAALATLGDVESVSTWNFLLIPIARPLRGLDPFQEKNALYVPLT